MDEKDNILEETIKAKEEFITLTSPDGEEVDFYEIAGIPLEDYFYTILKPVHVLEGMTEDDALVFKVTETENGESNFTVERDEETLNRIYQAYLKLLEEMENNLEQE